MKERTGLVTLKGNPLTLLGTGLKVGDAAPDVEVIDNDMSPVAISSFKGKVCILSSVTSLDTSVCDGRCILGNVLCEVGETVKRRLEGTTLADVSESLRAGGAG